MNAATITNRVLSALLALVLVVGGLLVAVEIVLAQLGRPALLIPWSAWASWLGGQTWDTSTVRLVLAGLVVVGLVLLILALRPGKPRRLALPATGSNLHDEHRAPRLAAEPRRYGHTGERGGQRIGQSRPAHCHHHRDHRQPQHR